LIASYTVVRPQRAAVQASLIFSAIGAIRSVGIHFTLGAGPIPAIPLASSRVWANTYDAPSFCGGSFFAESIFNCVPRFRLGLRARAMPVASEILLW
jgi:hypothetical protein